MSDIAKEAWRKYLIQLQVHPLRTKAITARLLSGCVDAISQKISGIKKLQPKRLLFLSLYGFVYGGTLGHFLNKFVDINFKGNDNKTVAKKVQSKYSRNLISVSWIWGIILVMGPQYIPQQFRVLFRSLVGSCWAIFLNLKAGSAAIKKD